MTDAALTGAEALVRTLADCGVTVCFANPGTSEMHLVAALDKEPRIRSVLCLFEGVATGAVDGFARMAGKPAISLLHLGPGYLNGGANLHNSKRAYVPNISVVGEHATYHRNADAPLASDIEALVAPLSIWTGTAESPAAVGPLAAAAYARAYGPPAGNSFLIVPADSAWSPGGAVAAPLPLPTLIEPSGVEDAAKAILAAKKPVVFVGGNALVGPGLKAASRLAAAGLRVFCDTFFARLDRGAGLFAPERLGYFAEVAGEQLAGADLMVVAGTKAPVGFFAYPGRPGSFVPEGCETISLGAQGTDAAAALAMLADALSAPGDGPVAPSIKLEPPVGALNAYGIGVSLARHLPEGAIIADDGVTSGLLVYGCVAGAKRHSWLGGTGGAIGDGMPNAIGAAVAKPDAKVVALVGDGSAMYCNQALWTMAREKLDIVTIICANRSYMVLNIEMARTGAGQVGPVARSLLTLDNPVLDWVKLAEAQGVPAARCATPEEFDAALERAMAAKGPFLIEAVI